MATLDPSSNSIAHRRRQYLDWIVDTFGQLPLQPTDGRAWSLNHARLALGRDLDRANTYFRDVSLTYDRDFMATRLLKTLLDFGGSGRLSRAAEKHLQTIIADWQMDETSRIARWPAQNTENHDLMHLTIGLFAQHLRGSDLSDQLHQLRRSLAWRFERGWVEWNSPRYQLHYLNPLLVLADHAPSDRLRQGARALVNLQLAERALLSVNGYLGGPFFRGWDRHVMDGEGPNGRPAPGGACAYFDNNRYDAYLPTMWLAFGLAEPFFDYSRDDDLEPAGEGYGDGADPRLNQDEGMFMATSAFAPHDIVQALAEDAKERPALIYRGTRAGGWPPDPLWGDDPDPACIYYYNTPHISMGSLQCCGWSHQTRYCNVMFAAEPAQNLRIELVLPGVKWDRRRRERRGRLVQHENWLVGRGELIEDGGLRPDARRDTVTLYRVGKGLAAHIPLDDGYHVIQVSDLDTYTDVRGFLDDLCVSSSDGNQITGLTTAGDRLAVDLCDMSLTVNGTLREDWSHMLHDSAPMQSVYGTGIVDIRTSQGDLTLDHGALTGEDSR